MNRANVVNEMHVPLASSAFIARRAWREPALAALIAAVAAGAACSDPGSTTTVICPPDGGGGTGTTGALSDAGSLLSDAGRPPAPAAQSFVRTNIAYPMGLPGTFGSGVAYDKSDGTFWMVTDRFNRTKEWILKLVRVRIDAADPTKAVVIEQIALTENGAPLTGADLDPEDVAMGPDGTLWIVEETKPYILRVNRRGEVLERIEPPMQILGRTEDRGFEGGAITPDGRTFYAMLQQGVMSEADKSKTLIVAYDLMTKAFTTYSYQIEDTRMLDYPEEVRGNGHACGLAATSNNELYVLERDNQSGGNARMKRVYKVIIPLTPPTTPLPKTLVVDLHKLGYIKEKAEGITILPDGRLVVANDNDGDTAIKSELWTIKL